MADNPIIYTGQWTNWEKGKGRGETLTLSSRDATILTSFVTVLLAYTGVQFWKILVYVIHQTRYREDRVDGFQHQQRVLLRNSTAAGPTAWALILQWWSWRNGRKTLVPLFLTILYLMTVGVLSIIIPSKLEAGGNRLLVPGQCGYDEYPSGEYNRKRILRSQQGSAYSQNCYESFNPLVCQPFPVLKTHLEKNVSCPFGNICSYTNGSVPFAMSTDFLDSRTDLGINTPESVTYREVRTCSLINYIGGRINSTGVQGFCSGYYTFGVGSSGTDNFTFKSDACNAVREAPYSMQTVVMLPGLESYWKPIPALNLSDAIVTLVLVASNGVQAAEPIDDPLFSFHVAVPGGKYDGKPKTWYLPDKPGSIMACASRHQLCNPSTKKCSNLTDPYTTFTDETSAAISLSSLQIGVVRRLVEGVSLSTLESTLLDRGIFALRAATMLASRFQMPLPRDQHIREAQSWFTTGLSIMQMEIVRFATGDDANNTWSLETPNNTAAINIQKDMCTNQLTPLTGGTLSYSLLALLLVICLCLLMVIISYSLEPCVRLLSRKYFPESKTANKTTTLWVLDDFFQLQRLMFEALGLMTWTNHTVLPVPVHKDEAFGSIDRYLRNPRFLSAKPDSLKRGEAAVLLRSGKPNSEHVSVSSLASTL